MLEFGLIKKFCGDNYIGGVVRHILVSEFVNCPERGKLGVERS